MIGKCAIEWKDRFGDYTVFEKAFGVGNSFLAQIAWDEGEGLWELSVTNFYDRVEIGIEVLEDESGRSYRKAVEVGTSEFLGWLLSEGIAPPILLFIGWIAQTVAFGG